jgi:hypothetical protein
MPRLLWHVNLLLRLQVYLNGTRLPIKSFADYCDMYLGPKDNGVPRIYERVNDRWEICVSATDGQFQQVRVWCWWGWGGGGLGNACMCVF